MTQQHFSSKFCAIRRGAFAFLGLIILFIPCSVAAQQTIYTHAYRQNWQLVNPAAMARWQVFSHGKHQPYTISAGTRKQWLGSGIDPKTLPTTSQISVEWEPNKTRSFDPDPHTKVGGALLHDRTDAIQHTTFMLNYARMLPLDVDEEHQLFLGMNLGAVVYNVDAQRLLAWDSDDPAILQATSGTRTLPEVSFGMFYRNDYGFYAGASVPQLVAMWLRRPTDTDGKQLFMPPGRAPLSHFYVMLGQYFSPVDEEDVFYIEPSMWVRGTRGVSYLTFSDSRRFPISFDVNCRAVWQRTFGLGIGYSTAQQMLVDVSFEKIIRHAENMQVENQDRIRIGLNYGFPLGWRTTLLGHSIELNLSYAFWGF